MTLQQYSVVPMCIVPLGSDCDFGLKKPTKSPTSQPPLYNYLCYPNAMPPNLNYVENAIPFSINYVCI